jgi:hypothetical protein
VSINRSLAVVPLLFALPILVLAADLQKGIGLYKSRRYSEAAAELRAVMKADPGNIRA